MRPGGGIPGETAAAAKCALASEVLRSFGSLQFPAIGRSMLPTIWAGDTLVVESVTPNEVQVGEVVVVGRHGSLCAHRVIGVEADAENPRWITQGDALPIPDPPVYGNELLGRVAYVIRAGRLIPLPAELSAVERLTAKVVRRSVLAVRTLVFLDRLIHVREKFVSGEVPCRG